MGRCPSPKPGAVFNVEAVNRARGQDRLSDVVYSAIREAILGCRLAPGDWLRQAPLAAELGVSQNPVREALTRLVAEGLAVRVPRQGVRIVARPIEDIVDIYSMRATLEGDAAELAATRCTPQQLQRLRFLAHKTDSSVLHSLEQDSPSRGEFHALIAEAAGRRYLAAIISQLRAWVDPGVVQMLIERRLRDQIHRDTPSHSDVLEALEARDGPRARSLMEEHIMGACRNLQRLLALSASSQDTETDSTTK